MKNVASPPAYAAAGDAAGHIAQPVQHHHAHRILHRVLLLHAVCPGGAWQAAALGRRTGGQLVGEGVRSPLLLLPPFTRFAAVAVQMFRGPVTRPRK